MTLIQTLPKLIYHRAFRGRHCENPAAKDKTVRPKVITWWSGNTASEIIGKKYCDFYILPVTKLFPLQIQFCYFTLTSIRNKGKKSNSHHEITCRRKEQGKLRRWRQKVTLAARTRGCWSCRKSSNKLFKEKLLGEMRSFAQPVSSCYVREKFSVKSTKKTQKAWDCMNQDEYLAVSPGSKERPETKPRQMGVQTQPEWLSVTPGSSVAWHWKMIWRAKLVFVPAALHHHGVCVFIQTIT